MTNIDPSLTHHRDIELYIAKDHPEDDSTLTLECRACGAKAEQLWAYEDDPEAGVAEKLVLDKLNEAPCVPAQGN